MSKNSTAPIAISIWVCCWNTIFLARMEQINHMSRKFKIAVGLLSFCLLFSKVSLASQVTLKEMQNFHLSKPDTIKKDGFALIVVNNAPDFSEQTLTRLIETFFINYPRQVKKYNKNSLKQVTFIIDPGYKGVAATMNGIVRYSPEWLTNHPEDIDVVTHETMHIVQAYPANSGPGWITEGIADYVRNEFGVNNVAAKWALPNYQSTQNYTDAYRVTAGFFLWLTTQYDKKLVQKLDDVMRNAKYTADFWKGCTGKSVDELWAGYAKTI